MTSQLELEIERLETENRRLRRTLAKIGTFDVLDHPEVDAGRTAASPRPQNPAGPSRPPAAPAGGPPA